MPQIRCTCGTMLDYPEAHAGKKLRCPRCQAIVETPATQPASEQIMTAELLPASWYWVAHVLVAGALIDLARNAPWRRLAEPAQLNVWLGSIVILAVLWSIRAGVRPGLGFHLLGATACTLLFGPRLAVAAMLLVVATQVAAGAIVLQTLSVNALVMGVFPVGVSQALLRLVERRLPPHLFVVQHAVVASD